MLDLMKGYGVKHTVIKQHGQSGLFPEESITFVVVDGFGLVEFLDGSNPNLARTRPSERMMRVCLAIQSDDLDNARQFMLLTAHSRCVTHNQREAWQPSDKSYTVILQQSWKGGTSGVSYIVFDPPENNGTVLPRLCNKHICPEMSTKWWVRVRAAHEDMPHVPTGKRCV